MSPIEKGRRLVPSPSLASFAAILAAARLLVYIHADRIQLGSETGDTHAGVGEVTFQPLPPSG